MSAVPATEPATSAGPAAPAIPAMPARLAAVVAVVIALVGAVMGPTGRLDSLLGGTRAEVVAGQVQVQTGSVWQDLPVGSIADAGSRLRTLEGPGVLALGDTRIELAPYSELVVGGALQVVAGTLVIEGEQVRDAVVRGTTVAGRGAWRVDVSGRVGAYEGTAVVTDVAGSETLVRRYEQVLLADGVVSTEPVPYAYLPDDRFDRVRLDVAIAVDDVVAALRRGLQATYGVAPQLPGFYLDFDGLDGSTVERLLALGFERDGASVGPPADVLVASVVTEAVARGAALGPAAAAELVRDLRVRGATWGLIVQAQGLGPDAVRVAADRALTQRRQEVLEGTAAPVLSPPSSGGTDGQPTGGDPAPGPQPGPSTPEEPSPDPDPSPTPDPTPQPDPETSGLVGGLVEPVPTDEVLGEDLAGTVDEVVELVDDLLDGPDDANTSDEDGTSDGGVVDGVVEGVTDTLGGVTDDLLEGVDETTESVGGTLEGTLGG